MSVTDRNKEKDRRDLDTVLGMFCHEMYELLDEIYVISSNRSHPDIKTTLTIIHLSAELLLARIHAAQKSK